MTTTIDTITDAQIRTLRDEAIAAGDTDMAKICTRALVRHYATDFQTRKAHEEARAQCAAVIADAEAQAE